MLAFSPNRFFNELERISKYKKSTLKNAYWRAKQEGLVIETSKTARLSVKGVKEVRPFTAKHLGDNARLLVIFDVPEAHKGARQQLRTILKSWGFEQIQKSVWASDTDYRVLLVETIAELELAGCVEIYESVRLFPKVRKR